MASYIVEEDRDELKKIDKEIAKATESFDEIIAKKKARKASARKVVVTLSILEYKTLHQFLGLSGYSMIKEVGMTRKQDDILYQIYEGLDEL